MRPALLLIATLLALVAAGCGEDETASSPSETPEAQNTCEEGTESVTLDDVIGTPPEGYELDPGRRKAIDQLVNRFRQTMGEVYRDHEAKVLLERGEQEGTVVVVINTSEDIGEDEDEFLEGVASGEDESGLKGSDIEIGERPGRLQLGPDGSAFAIAPTGSCAFVALVASREALLREAASAVKPL